MNNKNYLKGILEFIKNSMYNESKNINLLKEMPEMVLYRVHGVSFDTKDELENYCNDNNIEISKSSMLAYYRNFASRHDVIRDYKEGEIGVFYSVCDCDGYDCGAYNHSRIIYSRELTWKYYQGHIRELYNIFRDKGVVFENDIYAKEDARKQKLLRIKREIEKIGVKQE